MVPKDECEDKTDFSDTWKSNKISFQESRLSGDSVKLIAWESYQSLRCFSTAGQWSQQSTSMKVGSHVLLNATDCWNCVCGKEFLGWNDQPLCVRGAKGNWITASWVLPSFQNISIYWFPHPIYYVLYHPGLLISQAVINSCICFLWRWAAGSWYSFVIMCFVTNVQAERFCRGAGAWKQTEAQW